jgi:hypothetical protein
VEAGGEGSAAKESEMSANQEQRSRAAQAGDGGERDERRERGDQFEGGKRDVPVNQDA